MLWVHNSITLVLILITFFVTMLLIMFHINDPIIVLNGVKITRLELIYGTIPKPGVNMSLIADVSIKNPNMVSFKYSNTTTIFYYHDMVVGEAQGPPHKAKARRTLRVNITVDIITDRLMSYPNVQANINSGLFNLSSYSRISGQVQVMKIIKKHVVVKLKCTMSFNVSRQTIQEQKCKRPKVDL